MVELKSRMSEDTSELNEGLDPGQPNILFVEDDKDVMHLYMQFFEINDFKKVTTATNLKEAEKILDENKGKFDIVLTDRGLAPSTSNDENTDGYQVALKAKTDNPNTQVLCLTADAPSVNPNIQKQFKIDQVIPKGTKPSLVMQELRRVYQTKKDLDSKGTPKI